MAALLLVHLKFNFKSKYDQVKTISMGSMGGLGVL